MKASTLSVDKIEFEKIYVESNPDFDGDFSVDLKRLSFNYNGSRFLRTVSLAYPDDQVADPKTFSFAFRLSLDKDEQKEGIVLPYFIDVRAVAYMTYKKDSLEGAARFTAVRATGYAILYGAMREMVSNLTARGAHGLWMLPGADFNQASREEAAQDEEDRLRGVAESLSRQSAVDSHKKKTTKKSTSRKPKVVTDT